MVCLCVYVWGYEYVVCVCIVYVYVVCVHKCVVCLCMYVGGVFVCVHSFIMEMGLEMIILIVTRSPGLCRLLRKLVSLPAVSELAPFHLLLKHPT